MQLSFFSAPSLPRSFDDVDRMWRECITPATTDSDAFTFNDTANGRSYFFYGSLAFRLEFRKTKENKFSVPGSVWSKLSYGTPGADASATFEMIDPSPAQVEELYQVLSDYHRDCFRALVPERFGCCNDFERCSDARQCLHSTDRDYNGCQYRGNLENGCIFYGKNRNV